MLSRNTWKFVLVAVVAGLLALLRPWSDETSRDDNAARRSSDDVRQPSPAVAQDSAGALAPGAGAASTPGVSGAATSAIEAPTRAKGDRVRLQVHSPSDVQVGEVFQARIDLEAVQGVRQLLLTVKFEKRRLALVGWSAGDFARYGGLPGEVGAEEPSDGNIQVSLDVGNGRWIAGAGSMLVLEFEAIKAGTSGITLSDLTVVDSAGTTPEHSNVALVQNASVTIH